MKYDARRRLVLVKCCTACPFSDSGEIWHGICNLRNRKIPESSYDGPRPKWCPLDTTNGIKVQGT